MTKGNHQKINGKELQPSQTCNSKMWERIVLLFANWLGVSSSWKHRLTIWIQPENTKVENWPLFALCQFLKQVTYHEPRTPRWMQPKNLIALGAHCILWYSSCRIGTSSSSTSREHKKTGHEQVVTDSWNLDQKCTCVRDRTGPPYSFLDTEVL